MFEMLFKWNKNDKRQRQKMPKWQRDEVYVGSEKRVRWKSNFCVEIIVAKKKNNNKKDGSQSLIWMPQNVDEWKRVCGHTPGTCQTIPKARRQVINILWRSTRKRLRICIAAAHNIAENSFDKMLAAVVGAANSVVCVWCWGFLSLLHKPKGIRAITTDIWF